MSDYNGDPSEFKVYWFSRDLVASQFGNYAKKEEKTLRGLADRLRRELSGKETDIEKYQQIITDTILDSVSRTHRGGISKRYRQTEDLVDRIQLRIDTEDDIEEFILAIDAVVRTTEILEETPRFGETEIQTIVEETLSDDQGQYHRNRAYEALYTVDLEGEALQLGAQRRPLIEYISELMDDLRDSGRDSEEVIRIVSGIAQEYERRVSQSRSSTAGSVLETALQQIFDIFDIPATGAPTHFDDLELDNIAEGPEGKIGFSCKRSLRERFRQSLSRQAEIGVDEVWFVSLMMADISREKIVDMHNDGNRIYVPRDSFVWERYGDDEELSYTLRPADRFIDDVADFIGV